MSFIANAWYCAAFSDELGDGPLGRRILGQPVLMTRDAAGAARAIGDRCPHRFAPLHLGKQIGDAIQCPYHGLRFGLDGQCVHNPHGSGRIPEAARVPTFPVDERAGVVWLWPGDAELADTALIPDLLLVDRGDRTPVHGHLTMALDYRLVLDNLMDLSHAVYIHAGTLAPAEGKRDTKFDVDDHSIRINTLMPDVATPSSQALYFDEPKGDYHSTMEWIAPGTLRQGLAMTRTGDDPQAGAVTRNAHLITPETEHSTHYFWMHTRNRRMDDTAVDEGTRAIITKAFLTEDEPMIAACQDYMGDAEFFSLKPLYLETDFAGTRCRRIVERLIAAEAAEGAQTRLQAQAHR